jgi:hypothetical protein
VLNEDTKRVSTEFYICSLSSRTIVYKGQLMAEQVQHAARAMHAQYHCTLAQDPPVPQFGAGRCATAHLPDPPSSALLGAHLHAPGSR